MTLDPQTLAQAAAGEAPARQRLTESLYGELREIAARASAQSAPHRRFEPTMLIHEAFLKMTGGESAGVDARSRTHFCALAAVVMRQVLVDQVRAAMRQKRGGDRVRVSLTGALPVATPDVVDVSDLEEALLALAELDPRSARVVELRFFGGLTEAEIAEELGLSERTIRDDWTAARAWLRARLSPDNDPTL
jgi:RNA polymerase sigma factor (TIGR02999 family)